MTQLTRLVVATLAFVCAWVITATLDAIRAPGGAMFFGVAAIAVSIVAAVATLHRWAQPGGAGGGGPRRHPPSGPNAGGGSDPSWWPEFERQLALYVAERDRENRQASTWSS
jgi:hypothetical protein